MTTPTRCCGTCKWGEFPRTPTGRIKKNRVGMCKVYFDIRDFWKSAPRCYPLPATWRNGVGPVDGTDCPTWAKREEAHP